MARGALPADRLAPNYAPCMSTTRARLRRARLTAWSLLIILGIALAACGDETPQGAVHISRLADDIGPVSENFIDRALDRAEEEGAVAWVLMLDTPGGLITSTDEIVQRFLAAEVPVVVFVSPAGARAASAGTFITMASHIAAMAPNTQIGAAHPVAGGGDDIEGDLNKKITNDTAADIRGIAKVRGRNQEWAEQAVRESVSITGDEAVVLNVVDLVANDLEDLLAKIDGWEVQVRPDGPMVALQLANAPRVETNYNVAEKVLDVIANPNVAFILLGLGQLALIIELWSPGLVGPGIFGVIMLIAGFFALGPLDANPAGIALIVLALVLFAAEIFVVGFGVLGIGGIISLLLGGLILFSDTSVDAQGVSIWTLAVIGSIAGSLLLILGLMIAVDRRQPAWTPAGVGSNLIGLLGTTHTVVTGSGTVQLDAELWSARTASHRIPRSTPVRVVEMDGLMVVVEPMVPVDAVETETLGDGAVREV